MLFCFVLGFITKAFVNSLQQLQIISKGLDDEMMIDEMDCSEAERVIVQ